MTNPAWIYENLFVPAEFAAWAPRMVAAAEIGRGDQVLDVACGTGVLGVADDAGAAGEQALDDHGGVALVGQRFPDPRADLIQAKVLLTGEVKQHRLPTHLLE